MNYIFGDQKKGSYASVSDPNSADLTWETVSTWNVGLDLGFLNNRLNLTADAYVRDTKGMQTSGKSFPVLMEPTSPSKCSQLAYQRLGIDADLE